MTEVSALINQLKIAAKGPIPPFVLEVFLTSGQSYHVHSLVEAPGGQDEDELLVFRIWDFTRLDDEDILEVKRKVDAIGKRSVYDDPSMLHPEATWSALHVPQNCIAHFIVWHDKGWNV